MFTIVKLKKLCNFNDSHSVAENNGKTKSIRNFGAEKMKLELTLIRNSRSQYL